MLRSQWQAYVDEQQGETQASGGVCYLPALGVVRCSGADVANFLQGYLTCDTVDLTTDTLTPMAVCNLKGRVVVNGWCYRPAGGASDQAVILVVHRSLTGPLAEFLKPYLAFSKTEFADLSESTLTFGHSGTALTGVAPELAIDARHQLIPVDTLDRAQDLWRQQPHGSAESFSCELIAAGIPLISKATSASFLPQMLDLERLGAVNFAKGCYLGQEVVARAQHRGAVKRRLQRLDWSGPTAPAAGDQIGTAADPDTRLGTIINTASLPADADKSPSGTCLAVLANDVSGPFQLHDTVLNRVG